MVVIDSFLDSTVELFQTKTGESAGAITDHNYNPFWGFRVLTLVQEYAPALYESPTAYNGQAWALAAGKLHALKAKVENTENFPALAVCWQSNTVITQNDAAVRFFGGTIAQTSAERLFGANVRAHITQCLSDEEPQRAVVPVQFTHHGLLQHAELNIVRLNIAEQAYSYEFLRVNG